MRKYLIAVIAALAVPRHGHGRCGPEQRRDCDHHGFSDQVGHEEEAQVHQGHDVRPEQHRGHEASKIEIDFPKTVKISGKGLTSCKLSKFSSQRRQGLPHEVQGRHRPHQRRRGSGPRPAELRRHRLRRRQEPRDLLHRAAGWHGVEGAPGQDLEGSGSSIRSSSSRIPADLQQPAPGLYAALVDLKSTLSLKKGKNALVSSVGCKNKKHKFGAKLTFAPNPAQPPKPSASGTSTAKCK